MQRPRASSSPRCATAPVELECWKKASGRLSNGDARTSSSSIQFVKRHALEENDNGAMDFVCDLLATLAIEYDVAIDAPHHAKKGQLTPGDANSGRGASATRDAGRLIYTLTTMSEDEAKAFGISPEERTRYIRLDKGKVNLAPPARTGDMVQA